MLSDIEAIREKKQKHKKTLYQVWSILSVGLPIDLAQMSKESVILKQINRNYPNWNAKRKKKEWKKKKKKDRASDSSVQFSHSVLFDSLWPYEPQHARPPCPSPNPGVHSNPRPLGWWCHSTISYSVVPFSSCPPSFPASGPFSF